MRRSFGPIRPATRGANRLRRFANQHLRLPNVTGNSTNFWSSLMPCELAVQEDSAAPPVRATRDVDTLAEVSTKAEYHEMEKRLRARGFEVGLVASNDRQVTRKCFVIYEASAA